MSETSPICNFGWKAPNFTLYSTNDEKVVLYDYVSKVYCRGFLIMFICNHCPYVNAIIKKIVRDCTELEEHGILSLAVCSNDSSLYPEDSFEKMKSYSKKNNLTFPYLHDSDQKVASSYEAVCTPDFFGFNSKGLLQYRGRLDESGKNPTENLVDRELFNAMTKIGKSGKGPKDQNRSIGCSIKWHQNP